jgi:2-isopropylmalate synthase
MMKAKEIGVEVDPRAPEMKDFLAQLKELEFKGYEYEAADASFKLLLARFLKGKQTDFDLVSYRVMVSRESGKGEVRSEATVHLRIDGEDHHTVSEASGPVDALGHSLSKALAPVFPVISDIELVDYKVRILESQHGTDAIIRVQIETRDNKTGETWGTVGASDNIIEATWQALVDAVEFKLLRDREGV